jgi:uncharacterized protein (DUF362 family)
MTKTKVAIIQTKPETVLEDTIRLFELADGAKHLQAGNTTIIKDNISWHYPFPSANTTPWQLEGTIQALRKHGLQDIACVQNKTEVTKACKGEKLNLYTDIFKKYNVNVLFNFKKEDMQWIHYHPKAKMLILDQIYKNHIRIPDYFIGKNMVHLPTVKCHIYTTTTGAMKNAFGGLLNHKRHQTHTHIHETLVDLLSIQKEIHPGLFCIMDGTTAGNGPGPRVMKPVKKDILLASADQVAVDAAAAKIMGFCFHKFAGWVTWFGPTKCFQGLLTKPPLLYLGNFYSFFYHDVLHWPFKEKWIYKKWLKDSEWGRLFETYRNPS